MTPYTDLLYVGIALYAVVPAVALGLAGRLRWPWVLATTVAMFVVQLALVPGRTTAIAWHSLAAGTAWTIWQWGWARIALSWRGNRRRGLVWVKVGAALAPLLVLKFVPGASAWGVIGFLGISYVTFRAVDVQLAVHDGLVTSLPLSRYLAYVLFFPTLSAGPIDRYRRFERDLAAPPSREEYLTLLDEAVHRFFIGLLLKYVLAVAIRRWWLDPVTDGQGVWATISYMYAYSAYLYCDFAGYSAFAESLSRILGIRTPANFNQPWRARDLAEFWTRWHISLSFWLRDQVYMRFLMAALKRKWFASRAVASAIALALTFGAMGVWHGTALHFVAYGFYHAAMLIALEWWRRRRPRSAAEADTRVLPRVGAMLLTGHVAAFGFLIFSGRLF